MSKYTFKDKRNVVAKYFNKNESMHQISKETGINRYSIRVWVHTVKSNGINALCHQHANRKYTITFKRSVINYYLSHEEGLIPVALHFNINPSQVYSWINLFKIYGIRGIKPSPKGRLSKLKRKHIKKKQKLSLTEKETYEDEILRLKAKVHRYRLDHIVLKTLAQMKSERIKKRHRR